MAIEQPPREPAHLRVVPSDEPDPRGIVYADTMARPLGPMPWVCEALRIAPGRPSVFVGLAGTRKSFLLMGLELAVASATRVLGFDVRHGRALHIDNEATRRPTFDRFQGLARAAVVDLSVVGKRLGYAWRPIAWRRTSLDALCRLVDGFDLVGVDALRGCLDGDVENNVAASEPLDLAIAASEKTGAAFVFIDHGPGKPRGHSSKVDASQVIVTFATSSKTGPTVVSCTRDQVSGEHFRDFVFSHHVEGDALHLVRHVRPVPAPVPASGSEPAVLEPDERVRSAVLKFLAEHDDVRSGNDLAARVHIGKKPVLAALRALQDSKAIEVRNGVIRLTKAVAS